VSLTRIVHELGYTLDSMGNIRVSHDSQMHDSINC
jgi:hypothetical protein